MANELKYTCLAAPDEVVKMGFTTIVALNHDRVPLAAFKHGKDASAWCDEKNGLLTKVQLTQKAEVTKVPAPGSTPGSTHKP